MAKKQTYKKMGIGAIFAANLRLVCDVKKVPAESVMEYMNICRATYYKRMNNPRLWTIQDVESAAKLFGLSSCDMVSRMLTPEEVAA